MTTDLFLKLDGAVISPVTTGEDHRDHLRLPKTRSFKKRVLVLVLEAALGVLACAVTILAIFAWTGASL
jgi:hypothetical protein